MNVIFGGIILIDGFMYGADGSPGRDVRLKCIRYSTGQVMWSQSMEFGTMTAAYNKLLYLTENGILHIIEARPDKYNEMAQGRIFQKRVCWTAPVLSNGRIYARNNPGELICLDMQQ